MKIRTSFHGSKKSYDTENGGFILLYTLVILLAASILLFGLSLLALDNLTLAQKEHDLFYEELSASNYKESCSYQGKVYESD